MTCASTGLRGVSARDRSAKHGASAGFTLLEALIGLTILATAMVALFDAFASGVQAGAKVKSHNAALVLAQSLLAEATAVRSKPARLVRGQTNGLRWSITTSPAKAPFAYTDPSEDWQMYQIVTTVSAGNGRRVQLKSFKLARLSE